MKIYSITNIIVFILSLMNIITFLYNFSQTSNSLTPRNMRIYILLWTERVLATRLRNLKIKKNMLRNHFWKLILKYYLR
jgi:hypothetical protein